MLDSIKILLDSIVDYAGLFPPAKLCLAEAMTNFKAYHQTSEQWMLGNFILPISRLDEFMALLPQFDLSQWKISLILSSQWELDLKTINAIASQNLIITSLEFPIIPPSEMSQALSLIPSNINAFFEIPVNPDSTPYLEALKNRSALAKIRTGGMSIDAFPNSLQLSQLICQFAAHRIPFKATAGLHHPLRAEHRISYENNSPSTVMHGFLNVVLLAAFAYFYQITLTEATSLLAETTIAAFQVNHDSICWRDRTLNLAQLTQVRQTFFMSFGSCSFTEPLADLQQLQLVDL